jgi:hypothetical protein
MSGLSFQATMPYTAMGNNKLAGNAAMNWATGWTICAARGRIPTHTPMGTQMKLARAISMNTRSMVSVASPHTCSASRSGVFLISTQTMCHSPSTTAAIKSRTQIRSERRLGDGASGAG